MGQRLEGLTAPVTGSTSEIARGVAMAFAAEGPRRRVPDATTPAAWSGDALMLGAWRDTNPACAPSLLQDRPGFGPGVEGAGLPGHLRFQSWFR
jgi:NAD(P)-dependent dehydrogenase (short-subunit alcohol dehydrogenase family)